MSYYNRASRNINFGALAEAESLGFQRQQADAATRFGMEMIGRQNQLDLNRISQQYGLLGGAVAGIGQAVSEGLGNYYKYQLAQQQMAMAQAMAQQEFAMKKANNDLVFKLHTAELEQQQSKSAFMPALLDAAAASDSGDIPTLSDKLGVLRSGIEAYTKTGKSLAPEVQDFYFKISKSLSEKPVSGLDMTFGQATQFLRDPMNPQAFKILQSLATGNTSLGSGTAESAKALMLAIKDGSIADAQLGTFGSAYDNFVNAAKDSSGLGLMQTQVLKAELNARYSKIDPESAALKAYLANFATIAKEANADPSLIAQAMPAAELQFKLKSLPHGVDPQLALVLSEQPTSDALKNLMSSVNAVMEKKAEESGHDARLLPSLQALESDASTINRLAPFAPGRASMISDLTNRALALYKNERPNFSSASKQRLLEVMSPLGPDGKRTPAPDAVQYRTMLAEAFSASGGPLDKVAVATSAARASSSDKLQSERLVKTLSSFYDEKRLGDIPNLPGRDITALNAMVREAGGSAAEAARRTVDLVEAPGTLLKKLTGSKAGSKELTGQALTGPADVLDKLGYAFLGVPSDYLAAGGLAVAAARGARPLAGGAYTAAEQQVAEKLLDIFSKTKADVYANAAKAGADVASKEVVEAVRKQATAAVQKELLKLSGDPALSSAVKKALGSESAVTSVLKQAGVAGENAAKIAKGASSLRLTVPVVTKAAGSLVSALLGVGQTLVLTGSQESGAYGDTKRALQVFEELPPSKRSDYYVHALGSFGYRPTASARSQGYDAEKIMKSLLSVTDVSMQDALEKWRSGGFLRVAGDYDSPSSELLNPQALLQALMSPQASAAAAAPAAVASTGVWAGLQQKK